MNVPKRRVAQTNAFDEHVLATIRLNERRAQIATCAENSFLRWHAGFGHVEELGARLGLRGHAFDPAMIHRAAPTSLSTATSAVSFPAHRNAACR